MKGKIIMMKKLLVGIVCGLAFAVVAFAENAADVGSVRLKGYLGGRLDAMIERHVCGADVDYITACFREKTETKGWWQTEFWGKWMHSAVPYAAYADSEKLRGRSSTASIGSLRARNRAATSGTIRTNCAVARAGTCGG